MVDLVKRTGHSTAVAAQRYIMPPRGRDKEVAKALSDIAANGSAASLPERSKSSRNAPGKLFQS